MTDSERGQESLRARGERDKFEKRERCTETEKEVDLAQFVED